LLRIFSEEAKRAGKDTNDLTNGLDIVKRALETGVLENRGINRLQTQFPDINKAMISHFGTDDFQTLLSQGKDMVQIFHGIMTEFDKLPKSSDKFRDVWKRFTGELDLAFAKFGEQLAVVVLPLIKEVATALQFMFRNLDMTGFTKMSKEGMYKFREGLAGLAAIFLQFPSIIQMISGVLLGLVHDMFMFGVAAQYLWEKRNSMPATRMAIKKPWRKATRTERAISSCFKKRKRITKPKIAPVPVTATIRLTYISPTPIQLVVCGSTDSNTMPKPSQATSEAMIINAR
jgi:hypothetical protein